MPIENDTLKKPEKGSFSEAMSAPQNHAQKNISSKPLPKHKTNYGIELLRILSMYFIIVLHVLGQGGVSTAAKQGSAQYNASWIMLAFTYCAVNCYGFISGYVGFRSRFKLSKLIILWLTVVSINCGIWLIFYFFSPSLTDVYPISRCFTPLMGNQYWYFTCYFGLYILSPVLNAAIRSLAKGTYAFMLLLSLPVFSLLPYYAQKDLFVTNTGYSLIWLILLYLTGAYFKLHVHFKKRKTWICLCLVLYAASALFIALRKFSAESRIMQSDQEYTPFYSDYSYTSLPVIICSVCLFIVFSQICINRNVPQKIISFFSKATFSIYIAHTNHFIWGGILEDRFTDFAAINAEKTVVFTLAVAAVIFIICLIFEKIRKFIFSILKIEILLKKIPFLN